MSLAPSWQRPESPPAILLVEDDPDSRMIYATLLAHHRYQVLEASNGADGVRLAARPDVKLVFLDLTLPVLDGWEAARRMKQGARGAELTVVALTGHGRDEDRDRALAIGCDEFLVKPVAPAIVLAEVRRRFGDPSGASLA